jgi:hypothetical protein
MTHTPAGVHYSISNPPIIYVGTTEEAIKYRSWGKCSVFEVSTDPYSYGSDGSADVPNELTDDADRSWQWVYNETLGSDLTPACPVTAFGWMIPENYQIASGQECFLGRDATGRYFIINAAYCPEVQPDPYDDGDGSGGGGSGGGG